MSFADVRAGWDQAGPDAIRVLDGGGGLDGAKFAAKVVEALPPDQYPTIVELGAGRGRVTEWLTDYEKVYAVDIAPSMVARLKELDLPNVTPVEDDGTHLTMTVDGVYSSLVLMHNRRAGVYEIFENLPVRPGGRVAFQLPVYDKPVEAHRWNEVAQWTETELRELAEATGYKPLVIQANSGSYVRAQVRTIGPHHWDLHIFEKESP